MAQTLTDLFGTNATDSGSTLTINLADFVDSNNNPLLADPATATPAQKLAAWLAWLHRTQLPATDANGVATVDKTQAIVPQSSFQVKTFEVREDVSQIRTEFNFAVYSTDNTSFDPDDVI